MTYLLWLFTAGLGLGAAPVAEIVALFGVRGRLAPVNTASLAEAEPPSVTVRMVVEVLQALVMLGAVQLAAGGRPGLAVAGWGLIAGHVGPLGRTLRSRGQGYPNGSVAAATILLFMSPRLFLFACIFWAVLVLFVHLPRLAPLVTTFSVPVAALHWNLPDIFFVYGMVSAGMLGYHRLTGHDRLPRGVVRAVRLSLYAALIACMLLIAYGGRYVYRGFGGQPEIYRRGPSSVPVVAITFDDGPDPKWTPVILDILREHGVRATFFLVGRHVERHPEIAARIAEEGHEIGNHSYSHRNMWRMTPELVASEIDRAESAIEAVIGRRPTAFRPPRGLYNQTMLDHLISRRLPLVLWSLSSQDWAETPARAVTGRVLSSVSNGDILLFHDSGDLFRDVGGDRSSTVHALRAIIPELKDRGYRLITITEMMILSGLLEDEGDPGN